MRIGFTIIAAILMLLLTGCEDAIREAETAAHKRNRIKQETIDKCVDTGGIPIVSRADRLTNCIYPPKQEN